MFAASTDADDVTFWLLSLTTYLPGDSRPVDRIDDPGLIDLAADAWRVNW